MVAWGIFLSSVAASPGPLLTRYSDDLNVSGKHKALYDSLSSSENSHFLLKQNFLRRRPRKNSLVGSEYSNRFLTRWLT